MTFSFSNLFATAETDAIAVIAKIKAGISVAEADLTAAFNWLVSHESTIASTITTVSNAVGTLAAAGVPIPGTVSTAISDANAAVAGLNAMAAASSQGTPAALVAGYVAGMNAAKAVSGAAAAVASVQTPASTAA